MKKIILVLACVTLGMTSLSFAADGDFPLEIKKSNNVLGAYYVNDTTTATQYSLSTAHSQGTRAYASSSQDQLIYYKEVSTSPIVSSDLISAHNADGFASDAKGFTGGSI